MKYNNVLPLLLAMFLLIFLNQCVSTKKHTEVKDLNAYMADEIKTLKPYKERDEKQVKQIISLKGKNKELLEDIAGDKVKISQLLKELRVLQVDYDKLLSNNKSILNTAGEEKADLNNQLSSKSNQLNQKERELSTLEKELTNKESKLERLTVTLNNQQEMLVKQKDSLANIAIKMKGQVENIDKLNRMLNSQNKAMQDLKSQISKALLSFSEDELKTELINGKLYVSLSQELLFKSGSKVIDNKGKDALIKLSNILSQNNEIQITIEGHTDNDGTDSSNWSLSVNRAVSVVNILQTNGVLASRITASGRGESYPIYDNVTSEGKAKNRRTEIILSPDMSKVFGILKN